jgi:hypothetical protein
LSFILTNLTERRKSILRKFIDTLAILGFLMSAGMLTGTALLYTRLPSIISQAKLQVTEMVTDMIPGVGKALPLPKDSGNLDLPLDDFSPKF